LINAIGDELLRRFNVRMLAPDEILNDEIILRIGVKDCRSVRQVRLSK
jgi:hypothetical protein